ncbi:MAG: magnesium chelatase subunit D [Pseudomonadota bacterium]
MNAPSPDTLGDAVDESLSISQALWSRAERIAALVCVDPVGLGGICLKACAGPIRDAWLAALKSLAQGAPVMTVPASVSEDRLIGGLALEASLASGTLMATKGLLASADGGFLIIRMAERLDTWAVAEITSAIDRGAVQVERTGLSTQHPAEFACIALDESEPDEPETASALTDRLAFHITLGHAGQLAPPTFAVFPGEVGAARQILPTIEIDDPLVEAIVSACASLGIQSLRAPLFCLRTARAAAALDGVETVETEHIIEACSLVLGTVPTTQPNKEHPEDPPPPPEQSTEDKSTSDRSDPDSLSDIIVDAVRGLALQGLLGQSKTADRANHNANAGKAGNLRRDARKGRRDRPRRGRAQRGATIDLSETLRAAAPFQKLRKRESGHRLRIKPEDIQTKRYKHNAQSSVIFAVDASGSSAMARMSEAKGAVEQLLAECYVRRDTVALVAFRGTQADIVLPPTQSLVMARRRLAGLPGGGGTPLAAGLRLAHELADAELKRGKTPHLVILSDGRGNVALDGTSDRGTLNADIKRVSRRFLLSGFNTLYFDTSKRPSERSRELASALGADYRFLPFADAAAISRTVRTSMNER